MDTQITTIQPPDIKDIVAGGRELLDRVTSIEITTDEDLIRADALKGAIRQKVATFKPGLDEKCDQAYQLHKFMTSLRNQALLSWTTAETGLNSKMSAYQFAKQEAVRKENERVAREAQKKAEEQRRKEIEAAKKARDAEKLAELKEAPIIPVAPPPAEVVAPKLSNTTFRDAGYGYRIVNEDIIPRKYWSVDEKKIASVVKALGKECEIPGIQVFPNTPIVAGK